MSHRLPALACAIAAIFVISCGDSGGRAVAVDARALATQCEIVGGSAAQISHQIGSGCVNCDVSDAEAAADGDTSTYASLSNIVSTGTGVSIRISRPDQVFAAGRVAGAIISYERVSVAEHPFMQLRTYLGGVLQEETSLSGYDSGINGPSTSSNTDWLVQMPTSLPFDSIEFALGSGAMAGPFSVDVAEFCSDVSEAEADEGESGPVYSASPAAVIADLSTGNNPYHLVYRRSHWTHHPSTVIPGFPSDAPALNLSFGKDLEASLAADQALWDELETGRVYWIPQTNLLYLRTRHDDEAFPGAPRRHAYETANHGTLTAGVIARACPDCYLLVVSDPVGGSAFALDSLAEHAPWVDVAASTQTASQINDNPGTLITVADSLLLAETLGPFGEYTAAARRWAEAGKFYFVASGNHPLSLVHYPAPIPRLATAVAPWFTVVGGSYRECQAAELNAGKPTEFSSEYGAIAPAANSVNDYSAVSGTSFSTPLVATHFAQALKLIRQELGDSRAPGLPWVGAPHGDAALQDGQLSREELYDAFAQAATLFTTEQYSGPCGGNSVPLSPQPWLEMGWGYVGEKEAALAAAILLGNTTADAKPAEQEQYMQAYLGARRSSSELEKK